MEKEEKEKINLEKKTEEKKFKKKKSVNWDSKLTENLQNASKNQDKKPDEKLSAENEKEYLEIEVINKDGNIKKERVKYDRKDSKEFVKKREEISHDEYKKAKEFLEQHKNEE